jgi:hypothetical protein
MEWTRAEDEGPPDTGFWTAHIRDIRIDGAVACDQWPRDNPAWFAVITISRLHIVEPNGTHSILGPYKADLLQVAFNGHDEIVLCKGELTECGLLRVSLLRIGLYASVYTQRRPVCTVTMSAAWTIIAAVAISPTDYMLVTYGYDLLWVSVERDQHTRCKGRSTAGHSITIPAWPPGAPFQLAAQHAGEVVHVYSPCGTISYSVRHRSDYFDITPLPWGTCHAQSITHCADGWVVLRGVLADAPRTVTLRRHLPGITGAMSYELHKGIVPGVAQHGGRTTCALCSAVGRTNALGAACHCLRKVPNAALILWCLELPLEMITFVLALVGVY